MEMLSNLVMSELVSRSLSFLFAKCEKQTTATVQEDLQRLRHLLLRSGTIVEEAERRLVTNRAMLQKLKALRDETFRGNYVLDAFRCRAALGGGDRRKDDNDEEEEEVSRRTFALSRFNPAKRVRFPSGGSETTAAFSGASSRELQQVVRSLEALIGDTKELVVFSMNYTPLYRQPYSAHLFLDKCMFGRHMESERVMEFLLQIEPPGAAKLGVLPIVGPTHIGKSTLVEHVCNDERVRNHFSMILFYSRNDHKDETMANLRDNCVIKHQNDRAPGERLLIVIELLEDVDEDAWKRLYSSERSMAQGSRMIITSRSEKIVRLGTTQALRLKCLPTEAYWYFFKMHVFGSDDPGQHPKMASLALEIANVMQGSFTHATIVAVLLRDNFSTQIWSMVLPRLREYMQKNVSLIGEYPDDIKSKDNPLFTWSILKQKPDKYFMLSEICERGSEEEVPEIPFLDLLAGCAQPGGKNEFLLWKSRIPPCFSYVCKCEIRDMQAP
ncbi:disease resistance protein RGA2-like [Phragmites australis]|uniref:disease resistance protein RGA2-like n=1 Tax=Phragmites australis TaxID=29695 RepID=UPI002D792465|nr:disease resistance protein RGA2-like [Phragmites australis]